MRKSMVLTLAIILSLSFCLNATAEKNEILTIISESCGVVIAPPTKVDEDMFVVRVRFDAYPEHDEFFTRKSSLEPGMLVRIKHVYLTSNVRLVCSSLFKN